MNTLTLEYDNRGHQFVDPNNDYKRVWGFTVPKLDKLRLRVKVTTGPGGAVVSLADQASVVFSLKTQTHFDAEEDGDLDLSVSGFDTTDTGWHSLAGGKFSMIIAAPLTLDSGFYIPEFTLLDGAGTPNQWSLNTADYPLVAELTRRVLTGSEDNAPAGSGAGNWYDGTIPEGLATVAITIAGMTSAGKGIPVARGGNLSTLGYVCMTNTVTITSSGYADTGGLPVSFRVDSL